MYSKRHNGQFSIEEFLLPFGGNLDLNDRWVDLRGLLPWENLEDTDAPNCNATTGAAAMSIPMAFGALYLKQRLGISDEEAVLLIQESPYFQSLLGFTGFTNNKPFDPSMMVHFRSGMARSQQLGDAYDGCTMHSSRHRLSNRY